MPLFLANQTDEGGDVQMWPVEWRAILSTLTRVRGGDRLEPVIRERLQGANLAAPIRITLTTPQIDILDEAQRQIEGV